MKWNPEDYAKNSGAQLMWARDIRKSLNLGGHESILDVGCGDGKITADFAQAAPQGQVMGVDSSAEMIAHAQKTYPKVQYPNLSFDRRDARHLDFCEEFNLCFSNAALHWVDDHPAVLRGISQALKTGGQLVISCGGQGNAADILQVFADIIKQPHWQPFFQTFQNPYFFYGTQDYAEWLQRHGFRIQTLKLVPKNMIQPGKKGLEAWIRTTWMPFTEEVPLLQRETFISEVVDSYLQRIPLDDQGQCHVEMVRLEVNAFKL